MKLVHGGEHLFPSESAQNIMGCYGSHIGASAEGGGAQMREKN